ncbi:MAG: hypothetical protein KBG40_01250 [Bacteroidales bacterium]|nr:hypothetical protein [Bacteroidales bacterium]
MSINIYSDSLIYIVAPANKATGGPELLHQLAYHLRVNLKINTYMYYIPDNYSSPMHFEYQQYNNPFVREIENKEKNILIVPEIANAISILKKYSNIRKCIWWLSIDNFYISQILDNRMNFFLYRIINKIWKILFNKQLIDVNNIIYKKFDFKSMKLPTEIINASIHLVQSFYALNNIVDKGIPKNKIFFLSDYLNKQFLEVETDMSQKQNVVIYNPNKGYEFTKKIINQAKDIKFVPILNMTRQQVIENLQKAKVYIDFGNHPGKDRIPREAAILGCCVITSKSGSAAFYEDVPIPEEYKFDDKEENISKIVNKIKECFENFDKRYKDFCYYREIIKQEPQKFIEDLNNIFVKI